jgi:hypothetical protein
MEKPLTSAGIHTTLQISPPQPVQAPVALRSEFPIFGPALFAISDEYPVPHSVKSDVILSCSAASSALHPDNGSCADAVFHVGLHKGAFINFSTFCLDPGDHGRSESKWGSGFG